MIQITKELMSCQNQCVISLSKLVVPEGVQLKRMTLAVASSTQEIFIQNHKNVKTNKINFYRESIFLTSLPQHLSFNLYQVNASDTPLLLKQLKVPSFELRAIGLQPTAFRTVEAGFQLDWQSWIFSQNSEELNQCTDRDYSQLDFPFYNYHHTEESRISRDLNVCHPQLDQQSSNNKRRSSSTDGSSCVDAKQEAEAEGKDSSRRASLLEAKSKSPCRERIRMKSHLHNQAVK